MLKARKAKARFSNLLLDEGEEYEGDYVAVLSTPKEYADAAPNAVISAVAGQSAGPASENAATPAGSASTPAPTMDLTRLTVDAATLAPSSSFGASAGGAAASASASSVVLNFCRGATRRGGRRNASDVPARHARTQARRMFAAFFTHCNLRELALHRLTSMQSSFQKWVGPSV